MLILTQGIYVNLMLSRFYLVPGLLLAGCLLNDDFIFISLDPVCSGLN